MSKQADHLDTWNRADFIVRRLLEFDILDDIYEVMSRPDAYGRICTGLLGFQWEDDLASQCRERGWQVRNMSKKKLPHDLEVNGLKVQCKMSSQDQIVDIRPARPLVSDRGANRAYQIGDYDVLAVLNTRTGDRHYVPAKRLFDSSCRGYMAKWFRWDDYRDSIEDWTVFETTRPSCFEQQPEQKQAEMW